MNRLLWLGLCGLLCVGRARAEVRCAEIFGDHMVLQRDRPIAIWGTASPGERIRVQFSGQETAVSAGADGRWLAHLAALAASSTPGTLVVRGNNELSFSDVLVGEVWFCSGQSNMEKQIGPRKGHPQATDNFAAEIHDAHHPLLRLYQVPHHAKPAPGVLGLTWVVCTSDTVVQTEFSAVGYFFGRELLRQLAVPIGLIHSSFGASQIEAWMPEEAFAKNDALARLRHVTFPAWDQGMQATELYQSMVRPFVPFALRGFLWYQGEANAIQADDGIYTEKMRALVGSWREAWDYAAAPWYYVQIAPYRYSTITSYGTRLTTEELPVFWTAQAAAQTIPHSGMVATTDLAGDMKNIHPTNKRDVGLRLARLALAECYGRAGPVVRSPSLAGMTATTAGRLEIRFNDVGSGLTTRDGKPPREFTISGTDQRFVPANAEIKGNPVVVWSDGVKEPVAVRLGWHELANPNLVNSSGLPALPFRTDDWPVIREQPKASVEQPQKAAR